MNTIGTTARLLFATAAAATTLTLFSAVVSISEPQRSVLIAKTHRMNAVPTAPGAVLVATNESAAKSK